MCSDGEKNDNPIDSTQQQQNSNFPNGSDASRQPPPTVPIPVAIVVHLLRHEHTYTHECARDDSVPCASSTRITVATQSMCYNNDKKINKEKRNRRRTFPLASSAKETSWANCFYLAFGAVGWWWWLICLCMCDAHALDIKRKWPVNVLFFFCSFIFLLLLDFFFFFFLLVFGEGEQCDVYENVIYEFVRNDNRNSVQPTLFYH